MFSAAVIASSDGAAAGCRHNAATADSNITEKQNFEWYYSYGRQTKEAQAPVEVSQAWTPGY